MKLKLDNWNPISRHSKWKNRKVLPKGLALNLASLQISSAALKNVLSALLLLLMFLVRDRRGGSCCVWLFLFCFVLVTKWGPRILLVKHFVNHRYLLSSSMVNIRVTESYLCSIPDQFTVLI